MKGIQLILISGILLISFYYLTRVKNAAINFFVFVILTLTVILLILFPESSNFLAHKLGVGRGVDLIFYIYILFNIFILLKVFNRIRRLENTITEFIRKQALTNAKEINMEKTSYNPDNTSHEHDNK